MAKPFLRYLPARLKPLSAPAVWVPLTIFTLLSVFIWEYYRNPNWFDRGPILNANPDSTLTPDEQAKLSEIDTVDLLLEGSRSSTPQSEQANKDVLNPVDLEAEAADIDRQLAGRDDPFAEYAADYEFPGAKTGAATPTAPVTSGDTGQNSPASGTFNFGDTPSGTPLPSSSSALSNAIDRQQAIKAAEAQNNRPANSAQSGLQGPSSGDAAQFPSQPSGSSGSASVPFIRTTPSMSPPAGTTGYRAPATSNLPTFNQATPQTTRNPFNAPTAPTSAGQINPGQIGTVQQSPIARPVQPNQIPSNGTIYTAPRSTQPDQNRRAR